MSLQADLDGVRERLQSATGLPVWIGPEPAGSAGLELWPWRIETDAGWRNATPLARPAGAPAAAMRLYFMVLAAPGLEGLDPAFHALHEQPVFMAGERRLRLLPHALTPEQAGAIFLAAQRPLRPFLSYVLGNG